MTPNDKPYIIIGAGGHGKAIADLLLRNSCHIYGFTDKAVKAGTIITNNLKCLGSDDFLYQLDPNNYYITLGLGIMPGESHRSRLFENITKLGFCLPPIIDPTAIISKNVKLGSASQILMGAILQTSVKIDDSVIINSGAIIEHDCEIMSHSHVASGATLCGNVKVGTGSFIGAGSNIRQNITIGSSSTIGLGSTILDDVQNGTTACGIYKKQP